MEAQGNNLDKVDRWIKSSVTIKLITIIILMLLLLIPSAMIRSIIYEREALNQEAVTEVSSKWAGSQLINGPVLSIPLLYEREKEGESVIVTEYLNILPEQLSIQGQIDPERLKRGIYEVVVYRSQLGVSGAFSLQHRIDNANLKAIRYDQAFLTIGISDLRGIKDQISVQWKGQELKAQPGSRLPDLIRSGVTIELPDLSELSTELIDFNFDLNLQGSQYISFVPLGSTTNVKLASSWSAPSFNGNFLPDQRSVSAEGFTSEWKVLQLNRNFPQYWVGGYQEEKLMEAAFGVALLLPLDDYQKSMRSVKYMAMTIALTFLIFFLVEILNKRKIHPFQYAFVGLALCLFYILLISISEHVDFNSAYLIAATAVISMITLYSAKIFRAKKLTFLLLAVLAGIYGFLYVTLQLSDYALLMGSIGLTAILAVSMYVTRNIDWYNLHLETGSK